MADNTNQALNALLTHCIAEATAELGPEILDASKIYADMARRILGAVLDGESVNFSPSDQIITVRVADVEAWIIEAYDTACEDNSSVRVEWRMTDVGWKPTLSSPKQAECTCRLADGEHVVRAEMIAACPMHGYPPLAQH